MKKVLLSLVLIVYVTLAFAAGHTVTIPSSNNVTCHGACNGSATATVSGGVGPFAYSWSPSGGTSPHASSLCANTYTVVVTDSSDMSTATASITITEPAVLSTAFSAPTVPCAGSCTTFTGTASGGTPPYNYSWAPSFGLSSTVISTPTACMPMTTTYTLTVTDAYGCSTSTASTAVVAPPLTVTLSSSPTTCGSCTGSIVPVANGGFPPYTYNWVGPSGYTSTVANPTNLCGGSYFVTVTSGGGCTTNASTSVGYTGGPSVTLDSIQDINCSGAAYGTITVHGTGGSSPYSYLWSPMGQTTPTVSGLTPGNYTVTVSDMTGCSGTATYTVHNTTSMYPYLSTHAANCSANGQIAVSMTGGVPPYTYAWSDAMHQTTSTAGNLGHGYFSVVITDATGCHTSAADLVDSFCANVVMGKVYDDINSNCVQDPGDAGLPAITLTGPGTPAYTDINGNYTFYTADMNPAVSSTYPGVYGSPTCPASGTASLHFTALGDTIHQDFGFHHVPHTDLVIHPGWSSSTPGFQKTYWICYYNNSDVPMNATITFVYDSVLQFVSATMGGVHYPAQHKIVWTYTSLPPAYTWDWATRPVITFNVPSTLSITDSLQSYFEIQPIAGDAAPYNNTLTSNEPVTGSHDPNSKSVMPKGVGAEGKISPSDSVLMYTIHFQNNGNDTAHTVIVKDTLSPYLDPATIVPGAADHPYVFSFDNNNVMTFTFNNIMLPDSMHDEPASNGYFNYTVKLKPGLPMGTVITNTADIYFDFNTAVVTNTTVNTLADMSTGITTTSTNNVVMVYPNPFSDNTTFVINDRQNGVYSFELSDVLGKVVKVQNHITDKQFSISRNDLQNGVYFYKIYTSGKTIGVGKLVIQ